MQPGLKPDPLSPSTVIGLYTLGCSGYHRERDSQAVPAAAVVNQNEDTTFPLPPQEKKNSRSYKMQHNSNSDALQT